MSRRKRAPVKEQDHLFPAYVQAAEVVQEPITCEDDAPHVKAKAPPRITRHPLLDEIQAEMDRDCKPGMPVPEKWVLHWSPDYIISFREHVP